MKKFSVMFLGAFMVLNASAWANAVTDSNLSLVCTAFNGNPQSHYTSPISESILIQKILSLPPQKFTVSGPVGPDFEFYRLVHFLSFPFTTATGDAFNIEVHATGTVDGPTNGEVEISYLGINITMTEVSSGVAMEVNSAQQGLNSSITVNMTGTNKASYEPFDSDHVQVSCRYVVGPV